MKKVIVFVILLITVSLFGPIVIIGAKTDKKSEKTTNYSPVKSNYLPEFKVKMQNGEIEKISAKDYVFGCLAGEMPINFADEALKAQAVAAYTFALRKKSLSKADYDLTADYHIDQCFLTNEEIKSKWGDNYEKNREKLANIIESVSGQWLCYDGKPALTVYHAISCGKTNSSKDVWGTDIPYLKSVDSSYDKTNNGYLSTVELTNDEFIKKFESIEKINAPITVKNIKTGESGRVESVQINGKTVEGSLLQKTFGLRSSSFQLNVTEKAVIFTVFGYGHGVGMSQVGADYLAKNGSSYKEILHHYYSGAVLKTN